MRRAFDHLIIESTISILSALKIMDERRSKLLIVFKNSKYHSLLSIGDIQRAIINNIPLTERVGTVLRSGILVGYLSENKKDIENRMLELRTEFMPILNSEGELVDVLFWDDVFGLTEKRQSINLNIPVIIMAGGKGSRLKPLTNVVPKPLIPIGNKTIIEEIMDRFVNVGCNDFYLSVNYKSDSIKHYFEKLDNNNYVIDYFQEKKPLGTAGSLFLIKDKIHTTFFVSNCDIIIDEDYSEILKYHRESKNELTIVSALKHYPISYGTIETREKGILKKLVEKPELTFQINSGMYILERHLIDEIPENDFFHITTLIDAIQKRKGKVGVFPVSEGSWTDIGTWDEYLKAINYAR